MLKEIGTIKRALLHQSMQNLSELLEQCTDYHGDNLEKNYLQKLRRGWQTAVLMLVIFQSFTSYTARFPTAV